MKSSRVNLVVGFLFLGLSQLAAQNPIVAKFSVIDACEDDTAQFTNLSQINDSVQPVDMIWRLGDGSESTEYHPRYRYQIQRSGETESFNVTLVIRSRSHPEFADSIAKTTTVNAKSDASFNLNEGYKDGISTITVVNQATTDPLNTYTWSFCDGSRSSATTPTFIVDFDNIDFPCEVELNLRNHAGCFSQHGVDYSPIWETVSPKTNNLVFKIHPNPSNGQILLSSRVEKLTIYDVTGREIQMYSNVRGSIDTGLPSGAYVVALINGNVTSSHRLIIK